MVSENFNNENWFTWTRDISLQSEALPPFQSRATEHRFSSVCVNSIKTFSSKSGQHEQLTKNVWDMWNIKSWLKLRFSPGGHSLHSSLSSSRTPGLQPWDGKCFTGLHLFAIQNMGAMYDIVSVWWWYHYSKSKTAKKNDKDATNVLNAQRVSLRNIQSKTNKTLKNNFVVWVSFLLTMSFVSETKIMF